MKYGGYTGKILTVDLSSATFGEFPVTDELAEGFLGGRGFAAKILYDELAPGIDPLGPDNKIIMVTGPATGTLVPTASRIGVGCKSPLTGAQSVSYMGGHFGAELKYAGWDGVLISGVAKGPVTLVIDDGAVSLRDASDLWGTDTRTTQELLAATLGRDFKFGAIGPAGENLVSYANFMHVQHAAGRGGIGAVFGSKNLKAVAVRGSGGLTMGTPTGAYIKGCRELHQIIMENPVRDAFRWVGTTGMLPHINEAVGLPYRNHRDDRAPDVSGIHSDEIAKYIKQYEACGGCDVICGSVVEFERRGRSYRSERIEHESVWALGPLCGVTDLPAIMEAGHWCDLLGMDTMSAGAAIAWAMEAQEHGLLSASDTGGLDFSFGNAGVLLEAVEAIASREGFGDVLARGSRGAARHLGRGEDLAMQVKGLDIAAYAPRAFTGMALNYATTSRGADHNKAFTVAAEFLGVLGDYDRYSLEGKPELVKSMQDSAAVIDSLIMCMFTVDLGISVDLYARSSNLPTGMELTAADVYLIGERINTVERLFNIREGFTRDDDRLPPRFAVEPAPSDEGGHTVDVTAVMDEYYAVRGWDARGVPAAPLLDRLGLEHAWSRDA
ncbi:MAG: aldehyde ferredoxin oxidoreductase family protein [Thermoleophilia bacterium]|nr:aldehyde ferredoxin oxidoreductase family protein [Thermoleophilia bacterium]